MSIVACDIIVSNVQVAYLVLFRRGESLRSRFVSVPLELNTPEAIDRKRLSLEGVLVPVTARWNEEIAAMVRGGLAAPKVVSPPKEP